MAFFFFLKIKEKLTPARRYSYLVGKDEPCHTAMDRLLPIFMDDTRIPTVDEIEESFSVEKVTKDFFEAYKEKYLQLADYLDANEDFVRESQAKGFTTEQFTKKLLSQIVFLYFIQKKGWLGVTIIPRVLTKKERDNAYYSKNSRIAKNVVEKAYYLDGEVYRRNIAALQAMPIEEGNELVKCLKGEAWGTGPKNFMRVIFNDAVKRGQNYFDDCLEPLFYTGLNQERGEKAFFKPLLCRIPFLSGGLFEELDHYDWRYNNFAIPNDFFSNASEKGRDADGILDIFDRYNFTMAEDEPLEKEVAVDPEMLGKVFENLLEVKDRKSKGAFYTPREIVHYMCSESLIDYLVTKSGIPEEDIRKFITFGEFFKDEDARKTQYDPVGKKYVFDYGKQLEMPSTILDFKNKVNRLDELDGLLKSVRVVDPAVGSGAFPLGLLNEIVKARDTLTTYMAIPMTGFQRRMLYAQRSQYQLKTQTIKNCIFACDIEPSAADITKLRLWLALVIEDEIGDQDKDEFGEHTKPRKLPNLDCNVLCGNSLNDTFEGVKLICNTEALGNSISGTNISLADKAIEGHINSLIDLQDALYTARSIEEKDEIKKNIQVLYDAIIMEQLQVNPAAMHTYSDPAVRHASSKPFILWQLYFPKVFKENGGFDICIGNPPYVQLQKAINNSELKLGDLYKNLGFKSFVKTGDIYCLFYEKGVSLLRDNGALAYITSNKWMRAGYGKALREFFVNNTSPKLLIDFAGNKIFDTATVDVNILLLNKCENEKNTIVCTVKNDYTGAPLQYVEANSTAQAFTSSDSWAIVNPTESTILQKMDIYGKPLNSFDVRINRGPTTGFNDAFLIDTEKRDALIADDPKSNDVIRPIIRGRDIKKYTYDNSGMFILYIPWHFPLTNDDSITGASKTAEERFKQKYPAVYNHLLNYKERLSARNQEETGIRYEWYALQRYGPNYMSDFDMPVIAWQRITQENRFCLTEKGTVVLDSMAFIACPEKMKPLLLAMLNSTLALFWIKKNVPEYGSTGYRLANQFVEIMPMPSHVEEKELGEINTLISDVLNGKDRNKEIDECIYNLFKLEEAEKQYIRTKQFLF